MSSPKLTYTKGMEASNPFQRMAEKLYRLRKEDPCGETWPCKDEPDHDHRCMKHAGHGIDHKCNCGSIKKRRNRRPCLKL